MTRTHADVYDATCVNARTSLRVKGRAGTSASFERSSQYNNIEHRCIAVTVRIIPRRALTCEAPSRHQLPAGSPAAAAGCLHPATSSRA